MGVFAQRDLNKANASSGGNYINHPGNYECLIVGWKSINTKARIQALIVDLKILSADTDAYPVGSVRNHYLAEDDVMFDGKSKNILVAAMGLSDGLDTDKIENENWYEVLEASIRPPSCFLNRKIKLCATHDFKADGKKKLKKNPALAADPEFVKEYQFLKREFFAHDETRENALKLAAQPKAKK
jgi:hypothetical protein